MRMEKYQNNTRIAGRVTTDNPVLQSTIDRGVLNQIMENPTLMRDPGSLSMITMCKTTIRLAHGFKYQIETAEETLVGTVNTVDTAGEIAGIAGGGVHPKKGLRISITVLGSESVVIESTVIWVTERLDAL